MYNSTLYSRALTALPLENQTEHKRPTKNFSKTGLCQVCGDKASIINYGRLSCQSCKTFFRRNGFNPQNVRPCFFNNSCEVNMKTRRNCTYCRLTKCMSVGMSSDLIRKEDFPNRKSPLSSKHSFTKLNVCKGVKSIPEFSPFDLWHDDQFLLIDSEQKLLLNVLHAMDVYSATPQIRHIIENVFASSCQVLFNVKDAHRIFIFTYSSMRSFINSIPDFRILTVNEQCSLFERNLTGITNLYSVLVFFDTGIINNSDYINIFTFIYGIEMVLQLTSINKLLSIDFTTIKLMLIILAFSSNCSTVDVHERIFNDSLLYGTHRLLGSQNVYVELLWKYLVYQYGYYDSALRFARLIEFLLNLIKSSAYAYINNATYYSLVNDVIQKSRQWLITNENELVPLWGKI